MLEFKPDFQHITAAAKNEKPSRLPLYEHNISPLFMEKAMDVRFANMINGDNCDIKRSFECFCEFFKIMSYDMVSFEFCGIDAKHSNEDAIAPFVQKIKADAQYVRIPSNAL